MASYARLALIKKFRKEIEEWDSAHPMDTTHIQMASVDEMMSAYGYVPRRLPNFLTVTDGRFGYYYVGSARGSKNPFMSFEDAVRMHNGSLGFYSGKRSRRLSSDIVFARGNRIVEQVSLQRTKKGNLKSQTRWIKFCDSVSNK